MSARKLTISLDESVIKDLDEYAARIGVTRSAAVTFLIHQGYQVSAYPSMLKDLTKILEEAQR